MSSLSENGQILVVLAVVALIVVVLVMVAKLSDRSGMSSEQRASMTRRLDELIRDQRSKAVKMSKNELIEYLGPLADEFDSEAWYRFKTASAEGGNKK
jgi:Tfp pilus assembly protein FimT